ncbi:hypothetical protein [Candidatus Poriferisodalis sp.]|uniref:hypothetical protein n=1 Tax=Candidatus Poriferisodalis sp. TaxID=3101277 RepID=UPI003D0BFFE8
MVATPDTGERWLLKYVTDNRNADGSEYPKGDDWSERVANGAALRLGIPAARTELAFEHLSETRFGVISGSVLAPHDNGGRANEELVPGNELLPQPVIGGDRLAYTVDAVQQALDDVGPPSEATQGFTAWEVFVGYLLLDAVIGNTDRHEENWAVIASSTDRRLASTFDHASSLGFLLADERRRQHLATTDQAFTPESYADRAKSKFAGKPHPVDVATEALARCGPAVSGYWLNRCSEVDNLVEPIWLVPQHRMSETARQFAEKVLRRNCARLLEGFARFV